MERARAGELRAVTGLRVWLARALTSPVMRGRGRARSFRERLVPRRPTARRRLSVAIYHCASGGQAGDRVLDGRGGGQGNELRAGAGAGC